MLDRAAGALSQLLTPFPFLFGERPGQADLFLFYNLDIAERVSRFVYQRSIIDEIGGLGAWLAAMRDRPSTQLVLAAFPTSFRSYLADHCPSYRPVEPPQPLSHPLRPPEQ